MLPTDKPDVLGIDIGGANLKVANAVGESNCNYFPMWTEHRQLAVRLREMLDDFSRSTGTHYKRLGVTMTGEMADCFATRREGVQYILDQVAATFPEADTSVYAVDGLWLPPAEAKLHPWSVASSNWAALANWIICNPATHRQNVCLVLDVGSTTVDVIPVDDNGIATTAKTDRERLQKGQLVYSGVQRTPVAAILHQAKLGGELIPLVAERFATSDDAYLVLGLTDETPDCETADGRPRTRKWACARLARMLGDDHERLPPGYIEQFAEQIVEEQTRRLVSAIERNIELGKRNRRPCIIVSGHGRGLASRVLRRLRIDADVVWLDELLTAPAARCAPAVAVAWLLAQESVKP